MLVTWPKTEHLDGREGANHQCDRREHASSAFAIDRAENS